MKNGRRIVQVFLLVLIILGLGLLVTHAYWVPPLVNAMLAHEQAPVVIQAQLATSTKPVMKPVPIPAPVPVMDSGIDITATVGPTCPVMKDPPDPACSDKPYQTTLVLASTIIGRNGGILVKTDAAGHLSENLGPGTYTIRAQSDAMLPHLQPVSFTVEAHKRTALHLQFDSGIR